MRRPDVRVMFRAMLVAGLVLLAGPMGLRAGPVLSPSTREKLQHALRDSDRGVRYAAAGALGKAGEGAAPAVEDLAERLRDEDPLVRYRALRKRLLRGE